MLTHFSKNHNHSDNVTATVEVALIGRLPVVLISDEKTLHHCVPISVCSSLPSAGQKHPEIVIKYRKKESSNLADSEEDQREAAVVVSTGRTQQCTSCWEEEKKNGRFTGTDLQAAMTEDLLRCCTERERLPAEQQHTGIYINLFFL